MKTKAEIAGMVRRMREMAAQILTPSSKGKHFFNEVADTLEELQLRVSDEYIRGRLTRLEREHGELRAAWECETGKIWISQDESP